MGTLARLPSVLWGFEFDQQRVLHLHDALQQRVAQVVDVGQFRGRAGTAQYPDAADAGLAWVKGPFTEVEPVDRHLGIYQMQHLVGEALGAGTGDQFAQLQIQLRVGAVFEAVGQLHIIVFLDSKLCGGWSRGRVLWGVGGSGGIQARPGCCVCSGKQGQKVPPIADQVGRGTDGVGTGE
ncbi:hypothetical protein D3C80_1504050 [compost metagenome]